jgi:hypothetical protein
MNNSYKDTPRHLRALYPKFKSYGISGTQLSGGSISGYEQNTDLTGLSWVRAAEEMLRTDPVVKRSWHMLRQTLLSATWRWEPGIEGDALSEELASYANDAYGLDGNSGMMRMSFEEQLSYLFEYVTIGYRYAEEVYKVSTGKDGKVKVWLDYYADREPSAHSDWLSRDGQLLDGVLQTTIGIGKQPAPIPSNKLLLLTLNKTGSNFEGVGMLRPVWWWWKTKQRVSNLMCVGVDRWAIPTPKVIVDRSVAELQGLSDGDIDAMVDDAESQARAFLSTEQQYLVENAAVRFDSYSTAPQLYSQGPLDIIKECDNQISQAFLAQFANLGISDTGSRSVGEIHLSVFRRAAINLCDLVASQISGEDRAGGGTIGRLIKFNYGYVDPSKLPRLTHTGLDTDDLAEALPILGPLVQFGLLTPDNELERAIRQRLGAGELPEDAQRSVMDRTSTTSQGGPAALLAEQLIKRRRAHGKED